MAVVPRDWRHYFGANFIYAVAAAAVLPVSLGGAQSLPAEPPGAPQPLAAAAVLQGLDKLTARILTFEAAPDIAVKFGNLEIVVRSCQKRPPEEPPESAAFLVISEQRPDQPAVQLFSGWMFASSPALSALEHPVYDVWVVDCTKASKSAADRSG